MPVIDRKVKYTYWGISALMIASSIYYYFFGEVEITDFIGLFPHKFKYPWLCFSLVLSASIWISIDKWHNRDSLNRFAGACMVVGIMGALFIAPLIMLIFGWAARDAMNGAKKCT
jgi:hypothetical protein